MTHEDFIKAVTECGDAVITYTKDTVLLWCWDTDSYRLLRPANVTSIVPLSKMLKNERIRW